MEIKSFAGLDIGVKSDFFLQISIMQALNLE